MADKEFDIHRALANASRQMAAPKAKYNSFAKFSYRSVDDIVKAAKTPCFENGIWFHMTDAIEMIGDRYYIKATVVLYALDHPESEKNTATAYAREALDKKGCDQAQVTGMASSYARKYALCGLFNIDGDPDPDAMDNREPPVNREAPQTGDFTAHCCSCGQRYAFRDQSMYNGFLVRLAEQPCCQHPDWVIE